MQQANSNLLLIVWYLLKESNNKNNISTEEGKEWLYISFYPILESKTFDFNQILSIIIELIEKGIIEEIFLNPNDDSEDYVKRVRQKN